VKTGRKQERMTTVPIGIIYNGVYPLFVSTVLLIILLFVFPQIALFLPHRLMKAGRRPGHSGERKGTGGHNRLNSSD
jgi:hypothetical protein